VVDSGNSGISHSEGQAVGMFLAARHADREAFVRMFQWTQRNLSVRPDALLAWRYEPNWHGARVTDMNNATDADVYHAWALYEADLLWPDDGLLSRARRIAADILRLNVRRVGHEAILLPGAWGFDRHAHITLNPSYFHFRALEALDRILPHPAWQQVSVMGERLLREGRFGVSELPPDWIWMDPRNGRFMPARDRQHRFGFDAIRVPLHLAWGGRRSHPAFQSIHRFWSQVSQGRPPAWVDLDNGRTSSFDGGFGVLSIAAMTRSRAVEMDFASLSGPLHSPIHFYDLCLSLLVQQADRDVIRDGGSRVSQPG
jgi:endoglucanase